MELKKFYNLTINVESNEKGGSIVRLNSNHLVINGWVVPCQMGLVEWDSKVPVWVWKELFKKDSLPVYPFEVKFESNPKVAIGPDFMYMDGFEFNPYHVFDDVASSHHSVWNVRKNGNIIASIEAGVLPVDGEEVVYIRRGEFLGVLTDKGRSMSGYATSEPTIRFIQSLYESGKLNEGTRNS